MCMLDANSVFRSTNSQDRDARRARPEIDRPAYLYSGGREWALPTTPNSPSPAPSCFPLPSIFPGNVLAPRFRSGCARPMLRIPQGSWKSHSALRSPHPMLRPPSRLTPVRSVLGTQPGMVAGHLSATDQDAFDVHTFTLVAGAGATHNAMFRWRAGTALCPDPSGRARLRCRCESGPPTSPA